MHGGGSPRGGGGPGGKVARPQKSPTRLTGRGIRKQPPARVAEKNLLPKLRPAERTFAKEQITWSLRREQSPLRSDARFADANLLSSHATGSPNVPNPCASDFVLRISKFSALAPGRLLVQVAKSPATQKGVRKILCGAVAPTGTVSAALRRKIC